MARILLIDDSPTALAIVKFILGSHCAVERLDNFAAIPAYLARTPPDLVLLDINMPAISGPAVARFIRKNQQKHIPILLYSGLSESEIRSTARDINADGWVTKGDNGKLRAEVAQHLPPETV